MYTLKKKTWNTDDLSSLSFHTDRERTQRSVTFEGRHKDPMSSFRPQGPRFQHRQFKSPPFFCTHAHILPLFLLPMVRSQSICSGFLSHAGLAWENRKSSGRWVLTPQLQSSAVASGWAHWINRLVATPLFDGTRVFSDVIWDSRTVEQEPNGWNRLVTVHVATLTLGWNNRHISQISDRMNWLKWRKWSPENTLILIHTITQEVSQKHIIVLWQNVKMYELFHVIQLSPNWRALGTLVRKKESVRVGNIFRKGKVLYYSNKLCKEVGDFYSFLTLYIINYHDCSKTWPTLVSPMIHLRFVQKEGRGRRGWHTSL